MKFQSSYLLLKWNYFGGSIVKGEVPTHSDYQPFTITELLLRINVRASQFVT